MDWLITLLQTAGGVPLTALLTLAAALLFIYGSPVLREKFRVERARVEVEKVREESRDEFTEKQLDIMNSLAAGLGNSLKIQEVMIQNMRIIGEQIQANGDLQRQYYEESSRIMLGVKVERDAKVSAIQTGVAEIPGVIAVEQQRQHELQLEQFRQILESLKTELVAELETVEGKIPETVSEVVRRELEVVFKRLDQRIEQLATIVKPPEPPLVETVAAPDGTGKEMEKQNEQ